MKKIPRFIIFFLAFNISARASDINPADSLHLQQTITAAASDFSALEFSQLENYINDYIKENVDLKSLPLPVDGNDQLFAEGKAKEVAYEGNPQVQKVNKLYDQIIVQGKLLEKLSGELPIELPVGINLGGKANGGSSSTKMVLIINRVKFLPSYASLEAYFGVELKDGRKIFFGTDDLRYNSAGFVGVNRLVLFESFPMFQKSKHILLTLNSGKGQSGRGSYVEFDCEGFRAVRIDATLELSRDWVIPCSIDGTAMASGRVMANFAIDVADLDDFVLDISLPFFTPTKAKEKVVFNLEHAVFDHSDTRNAAGFTPRRGYTPSSGSGGAGNEIPSSEPSANSQLDERAIVESDQNGESGSEGEDQDTEGLENLWRGIFIKELKIILPKAFKRNEGERISAAANDLYIDNGGVTGNFSMGNLIAYESGKMQKWKFSVDKLSFALYCNIPISFSFDGRIAMPITSESTPLKYAGKGNLELNVYNFTVSPTAALEFPLWRTTSVSLNPASYLKVQAANDQFNGEAVLHGYMGVNAGKANEKDTATAKLTSDKVTFAGITILTVAPYLGLADGGFIRFDEGNKDGNNALGVNSATLSKKAEEPNKIYLGLDLELSFTEADDGGSKVSGSFAIVARMEEQNGIQRWVYDGVKISAICVTMDFGNAGRISGCLERYSGDAEYGDGYAGNLDGGFMKDGGSYKLVVQAGFKAGTKTEGEAKIKYWFFSGYLGLKSVSIPIIPGVLNVNGFGGGMYYHMRMEDETKLADLMAQPADTPPTFKYVVDKSTTFGFKASLGLAGSNEIFVANVTLQMEFSGKALQNVFIAGKGKFVSRGNESAESASIRAVVLLKFNFEQGFTMHGAFAVTIDVKNVLNGSGQVDILSDHGTWHLYIGGYSDNSIKTSDGFMRPVSANITFSSGISVSANMYFLTGNDIPSPPPLNAQAAAYFGVSQTQTRKNEGEIVSGTGFAFGASAFFNTSAVKEECKYVNFTVSAGFDFSLLKYGDAARCSNTPSNTTMGINSWRATGNLYAYCLFGGKWKILWRCKNLPSFNAGLLLMADVPNPGYFLARVKFSILGIKVDVKGQVGTECGNIIN